MILKRLSYKESANSRRHSSCISIKKFNKLFCSIQFEFRRQSLPETYKVLYQFSLDQNKKNLSKCVKSTDFRKNTETFRTIIVVPVYSNKL